MDTRLDCSYFDDTNYATVEVSAGDEIYKYDRQQQQSLLAAKPWEKDPHFFKDIKISALALLKMVMHARSGGNLEIMGLLLGKVRQHWWWGNPILDTRISVRTPPSVCDAQGTPHSEAVSGHHF